MDLGSKRFVMYIAIVMYIAGVSSKKLYSSLEWFKAITSRVGRYYTEIEWLSHGPHARNISRDVSNSSQIHQISISWCRTSNEEELFTVMREYSEADTAAIYVCSNFIYIYIYICDGNFLDFFVHWLRWHIWNKESSDKGIWTFNFCFLSLKGRLVQY